MNSPFIFLKNNLKSKSSLINLLRKHIPLNDERLKLIKEKNQINKNLIRKTEIKIASNGLIDEIKIKVNELFEEINFKIDHPLEKKLKIEYLKEKLIEVSTIGNDLRKIAINLNPKITLEDYKDLHKSLSSDNQEITASNTDTIITYDDFENDILVLYCLHLPFRYNF